MILGKIIKQSINMTIKRKIQLNCLRWFFFSVTGFVSDVRATVAVPPKEVIVQNSDSIFLCNVSMNKQVYSATIKEVLKGEKKLAGQTVELFSPYTPIEFPLESWIKEANGNSVILVGKYDANQKRLTLFYGTGSFWPRGAPTDVSKSKNIEECRKTINELLNLNSREGSIQEIFALIAKSTIESGNSLSVVMKDVGQRYFLSKDGGNGVLLKYGESIPIDDKTNFLKFFGKGYSLEIKRVVLDDVRSIHFDVIESMGARFTGGELEVRSYILKFDENGGWKVSKK